MKVDLILFTLFAVHQQCLLADVEGNCPANDPMKSFAVFERMETGKALHHHVIHTRIVASDLECSLICLRHAQCASFNYQDDIHVTRHVCELNDETRLTSARDLLQRNGFSYYGIEKKPCFNVICQNGGSCQPMFESMAAPYCCRCQHRYGGPHCEHFMGFRFTNSSSGDHALIQLQGQSAGHSWTLCLWIKAAAVTSGVSTPLSYVMNGSSVVLQLLRNRTVRVIINDHFSDFPYVSLMENTWHHVCVTWETIAGNLSLYVDGLLIGQQSGVHPGLRFNKTGTLVIGQVQKTSDGQFMLNESFFGGVSDVNIWRSVLSFPAIKSKSRACYGFHGDWFGWPTFSNGLLKFQNDAESVSWECGDFPANYDLEFPRKTKEDYILLTKQVPSFSAFTVSFFVSFINPTDKAFVSYFVKGCPNEMLLHERAKKFMIRIKGVTRKHDFIIPRDGLWHHVTVTWENVNGTYEIFVNGKTKVQGHGLKNGTSLKGGGTIALGNDYDASGFHANDAYVGKISRVNIWNFVLSRETIASISQHCGRETGETVDWTDFRQASFHGDVNIREPSSCERP